MEVDFKSTFRFNMLEIANDLEYSTIRNPCRKWAGPFCTTWSKCNDYNPETVVLNVECGEKKYGDRPMDALHKNRFVQSICAFHDLQLVEVRANRPVQVAKDYYKPPGQKVELEFIFECK